MIIYFGIGTNLGNREQNLSTALDLLDARVGSRIAVSSIYKSQAQGFESDNEFANIVAVYATDYSQEQLLEITQQIEREMGRTKKSVNGVYHDRVIDIDLLLAYEKGVCIYHQSPTLILPHPRMHERDFVMIPLREVKQDEPEAIWLRV